MEKKFTIQELVKRIKYFCDKKGYDYATLSRKSGVPLTTLLNIIKENTKNPGIFTILKLCEGFEITIEEFLNTKIERDCNTCANNTAPDEIDNGCYMCSKGLENNYESIQEESNEERPWSNEEMERWLRLLPGIYFHSNAEAKLSLLKGNPDIKGSEYLKTILTTNPDELKNILSSDISSLSMMKMLGIVSE